MPSLNVTVVCGNCNRTGTYHANDRVKVGDGWPDPCKNCGTDTDNEITDVKDA